MPVDMKGFKVVYGNQAYTCLQVEPLWTGRGLDENHIDRPMSLRVSAIDHDARFMVIEDEADCFSFLKEK